MKNELINKATYLVLILGALLHVYLAASHAMASTFNLILTPFLNIVPYAICLILLKYSRRSIMALSAGLLILMADLYLFSDFLFNKKIMGYNLIGIFTPVWKL